MNTFLRRASIILIVSGVFFNAGCKNIVGDFPGGPGGGSGGAGFSVTTTNPPLGVISRAYNFTLQVSSGSATWTITSGTFPNGMTLSSSGVLSGTPTETGRFNFTVDATSGGETAVGAINLDIAEALALPANTLPNGLVGNDYSQSLIASGGIPGYTWVIQSGAPPPGLSITDAGPGNATFSGNPTTAGRFTFTVSVTDAGNAAVIPATITAQMSLVILGAPGAFIANSGDNTVSVVDISTNTLIGTIAVGASPQQVALSFDSTFAFVTNRDSNTLSIIDAISNSVIGTVNVGANPMGVFGAGPTSFVFVANQGDNTISIVDFVLQVEVVRLNSPFPNSEPTGVVAIPSGRLIFVSLAAADKVIVINNDPGSPAFHSIVGVIDIFDEGTGTPFANRPTGLGYSASSSKLFVSHLLDNNGVVVSQVTIVDVDTTLLEFKVGESITVGPGPAAIGTGPMCNYIHAANSAGDSLSVLLVDAEVEWNRFGMSAGAIPSGVAFNPDGDQVYVTLNGSNEVAIFSETGIPLGSFPVGANPVGIAIQPNPLFRILPVLPDAASRVFPVQPDERMPDGGFNVDYLWRVCATGGIGPFLFEEVGGELPPGLTMDETGLVEGKPSEPSLSSNPANPNIPHFPEKFVVNLDVTDSAATAQTVNGDVQIRVCCFGFPDHVYTANFNDNTVSAVAVTIDQAVTTVITDGLGTNPLGVVSSPDSTRVYVSNFGSGTVSVIDTTDVNIAGFNTVIGVIGVGLGPSGMGISSDGRYLYVANEDSNTVSVVDTTIGTTVSTVSTGLSPQGVAVIDTAGGHRAYVPNIFSDSVTVIDTSVDANGNITGIATSTIAGVGQGPVGIDVAKDQSKIYVTNQFSDTVRVIDTATNTLGAAISVGNFPTGIVVATASRAYVANQLDNTVSVINLFTESEIDLDLETTEIDRIAVDASPDFLTAAPEGFIVFVSSFAADSISSISTFSNEVLKTTTVGVRPEGVQYVPFRNF